MRRLAISLALAVPTLLAAAPARAQIAVAVDPTADAHPISPLIYGVNFPSAGHFDAGRLTVGRWGGNSVTRYNYETDTINTAADYYFENIPGCWGSAQSYCATPPADPKESSGVNAFLADMKTRGAVALFTIPTIGWVAKPPPKYGHPFDCGCPATAIPNQNSFDPYDTNCGDGLAPGGGSYLDCGPATNTSVATSPDWAKAWVGYIVAKHGPANGQRIYALDNEPALWSSTHRDIRKTKLGYDELWQRMRDYAVAILEADPTAEIAGPAEWGWPNYFCSDADNVSQGCSASSPDRAAHGGQELVAWLLEQAKAYEDENGKRILHYLDLHYYPQGGNVPEVTRSLWDPGFTDPSWINENIRLVPRMRDWVDQHYPGTKLAVSEYDFYQHDQSVGAVTYAEVLGIFAREGVHVATAWSPPDPDQPAFAAFKLFRNFDGAGAGFEAVSVRAAVSGGAGVEAYAAVGQTRMTVALVNENGGAEDVTVSLGNFMPGATAQVYGNDGGSTITKHADVAVSGGSVTVTLPSSSITMLVVDGMNPNELPDGGTGTGGSGTGGTGAGGGSSSGGTGAGTTGSGGNAPASGGSDDGGCGCRTAGAPGAIGLWAVSALGLGIALGGRRRRAKRGR